MTNQSQNMSRNFKFTSNVAAIFSIFIVNIKLNIYEKNLT